LASSSNYNVFAHLTAEKCVTYRTVLNVFTQAKARFVIHLRPTDVERQLADDGMRYADATAVEMMLQQLMAWGNLEAHPDTAEVLTVDDFWRVRNLYQMSAAGEAAEAALAVFEQSLRQPGELQAAALDDIRKQLDQVIFLSRQEKVDDADVFNAFSLLRQRFDELTAQAQRFIGGLQRRIELQGLNVESFLIYKQRLIDYLERFLSQLVLAGHEIAMTIRSIEPERIAPLLHRAAERELVDRLTVTDEDRAVARRAWQQRWEGLCSWFVGSDKRPSQAEELRGAARAAIPSLVAAVTGMTGERGGAIGQPTCGHWLCGLQKRRMIKRPIDCGGARLPSIPVGIYRLTPTRWTSAAPSLCRQRRAGLMPRRYGFRRGCTIPGDTRRGDGRRT